MGISSPYSLIADGHTSIVRSDTVNITDPAGNALPHGCVVVVLAAGNVSIHDSFGNDVTWIVANVPYAIPVRALRVNNTNTNVANANMVGVY